ncbi:MAG: alpha/beta fold hydrolase [Bacteroidales bacterium]|jgi:dienelactone hydrolase|nr:alpha/beta fold hydrolase [Bacteroidales bacterium]NLM93665.1 alpha/beta fold hydrolase [Bacteroidales bacterium]
MKACFAILFTILFAAPALSQELQTAPPDVYEQGASQLLAAMQEGTADDNMEIFTEELKAALSSLKLQDLWAQLQQQVGSFRQISRYLHEESGEYHVVMAVTEFSNMELALRLVYDPSMKIAGLQFVQAPPLTFTPAPAYADTTRFIETELAIDCGDIQLPALLAMPRSESLVPLVVLVHGSGPNDIDETIGPNKPFRDIAWGLATQGIAVLRYEKRTKNKVTSLDMKTMTPWEETGMDAVSAAKQAAGLEGVDPQRIFVLGHSLGGMMAPEIARQSGSLAGIILLGGNSGKLYDIIIRQYEHLAAIQDPDNAHGTREETEKIRQKAALIRSGALTPDTPPEETILNTPASYWLYIKDYNQAETARQLDIPTLILQGERDYQVDMLEYQGWQEALGGRPKVRMKSYPGLNHLFFHGEGTPKPEEYYQQMNTDVQVIMDISSWIQGI